MRVGVIDDDETALAFIRSVLTERGHVCVPFRRGRDLIGTLPRDTFDLLVIDWNLPDIGGLEIVRWARANIAVPPAMLMLTARHDRDDIVAALEAGADDYIVKPETAKVVAARIDAVLRRTLRRDGDNEPEVFGRYSFDLQGEHVLFDGRAIELTPKEYALALHFFQRRDRPLSRAYLLECVWKSAAGLSTRTLDMHVSRLRAKLQLRSENGYRLQTVFGYGYRLDTYVSAAQDDVADAL